MDVSEQDCLAELFFFIQHQVLCVDFEAPFQVEEQFIRQICDFVMGENLLGSK